MTELPGRPPAIRVSDGEREQVADRLRYAAGEGRLSVEELSERLEAVYDARTDAELAVITKDLPATLARPAGGAALSTDRKPRRWTIAFMGGGDRRGRWRVGRRFNAVAVMGGGEIDLREATLVDGELTMTVVAVMGGFDILVPPGADVEVSGFAFMGGRDVKLSGDPLPPGAPRIHIRAFAVMGGIDIKEFTRREARRRRRHGDLEQPEPPAVPPPPDPPQLPPRP